MQVQWTFDQNHEIILSTVLAFDCNECCSSNFINGSLVLPDSCQPKHSLNVSIPLLPEGLYFSNKVLKVTEGIDYTESMNWPLFGFLALGK